MDYDDNDFQLVGEDNNKFPSSLRSFPLPKFDVDEHLQVHLRFDSLVEAEVLLGIQGQGNNWIEDFTPVGREIEFSSSAAESCSISRHKNVWSEATSSESVEMLLKSVGEDEMTDHKAVIKEADADDGLNGMDGQMDTCLRQNDPHYSKTVDIINTDPLLPSDNSQKSLSMLNGDAMRDEPQVDGTPQPSNKEKSGIEMDVSSLSEKLKSEERIADQYSMDKKLTSSSDYATKKSSVTDEAIREAVQNDNPSHKAFTKKCAIDDHIASAVCSEDSDSITFRITPDPSSASTSNLIMVPSKMNTQMLSEQAIKEYSDIDISEKSGLLADDAQKKSSDDHIASAVCGEISDSITFRITPDSSSASTSNLNMGPAKMNTQMLSEQAIKEYSEIDISEKSGLLADDAQKESSQIRDSKVNDQSSHDSVARSCLSSAEDTSFLDPTMDSLALSNEGCNERELPENPDGLLDTITYQVKALNKDSRTIDKIALSTKESHSSLLEGDRNMEKFSVKISKENIAELSHITEVLKNAGYGGPVHLSKDDATHVVSTVSIENTNMVDSYEGRELNSLVEVIEEKQDPEVQLTDNDNDYVGNTSKFTVEVHSSIDISYEIARKETDGGDSVGFSPLNFTAQNPNSTVIAQYVENIVKEPEVKFNAPKDDRLEESLSPALLDDAEKISSSGHSKSFDKCDTGELVAEPFNYRTFPPEVAAFVKENTSPSMNSGRANSNEDASIVNEKMEDALSAGQKLAITTVMDCSPAKKLIQDESAATALASVDVNLHCLNNPTNVHQSQPEDTLPVDVVVKQKEEITPLAGSDFIQPDEKEVEISESSALNYNLDGQISRETVEVMKQKEMITPLPASDFIQPDEKELEISESTALNCNLDAQISRESVEVSDPVVVDGSPAKDMTQDEPAVKLVSTDNSINIHQTQSEDAMVVDVVVEHKEEATSGSPVSDFIHSNEKEMKISGVSSLSFLKGIADTQISRGPATLSDSGEDSLRVSPIELQPVVGQSSSSAEASDVECQNKLQSSIDNPVAHEHATWLEGDLVAHASSVKGNVNSDSSGAFTQEETILITSVETASHDERQAMPVPPSLDKSSSGDGQNKEQISDANLNGIRQTEDDAVNHCTNCSSESVILTRSNVESHTLGAESANPSTFEQNCGSPTVINCSVHSQEEMYLEGNRGLPDQTDPVLDDPPFVSSEIRVNGDKVKSCTHDSKESAASEEDRSFTFEVGSLADLSERDTGNKWKPFSNMQSFELPQVSKENSEECHLESVEGELHGTINKTPDEDKTRQVSGCSTTERITTSQGEIAKEIPIPKQSAEKDGNPCSASPKSVGTVNRNVQLEEMEHYPYIESNIKASCSTTVQTSSLPDLNTSISAAALFHQPFTDLQQVQLRAQIFVYGSLIQGITPDEACMISAFGETDGGRSFWEGVWHVSAERYQNQKSPFNSCETPSHPHSGIRVSQQVSRCNSVQSKVPSTPSRSGSKIMSSAMTNSTVPLPSPLWSVSTRDGLHSNIPRVTHLDFNQALSPLHSHQSSQIRQYTGNSAPWLSQTPRPGPWVASSQNSTLDATAQYSALPVAETVQVTPVRNSSVPRALNMHLVSPTTLLTTPGATSVSSASVVQIESQRKTSSPGNNKSTSTVQKSRKRKKVSTVTEELQPNILVSEPASATGVTKHSSAPTSAGLPVSANTPTKVASGGLVLATSHIISPTHYQIIDHGDTEQRAIFSEETHSKIEQAKLLAEDAAAFAASAVRHSQGIWSQLATHKNSGLVSEIDEKLASAAVAAAAAASVARAAAAAAKVASDAALQAKMMADEALNSVKTGNLAEISETGPLDAGKSFARLTPVSILKGKDKVHSSSSIISAAREAARRRVEAASAATKRAENLDAIVKAAELAAEAVYQAGTIIAMGEPLPFTLSELVEAGPEGHWKGHHSTTVKLAKTNSIHQEEHMGLDSADNHDKSVEEFNEQPSNNKETQKTTDRERMASCNEHSMQSEEHYKGNGSGDASSTVPIDRHEMDHFASNNKENSIQKGSLVEVIVDEDGLRGVWFSARVIDVKDGKTYVCFNNLVSDEGTGPLKEWISLEGESNKAPRIRLAHPMTATKYEGTRKRRREAIGNYVWAVGDRVDAWIRDGWWEGIVTEKSQGDDTKFTIHFPDGGDSSIVRAWNLRPSLVWKDGHWIEWSRARESALEPYEGDTPQEKRQKLGRPEARNDSEIDGKGISRLSKNLPVEDLRKPEESRPLVLSSKDKNFSVGKNGREENNSDGLKVRRTGLQKEGSRVVFGVPKPGKKRKFMEVSKHYVADKTDKISEGNDSIKFAKYLMPQASRIWRNTSKVDPKGKSAGDSKPKGLKSVKSQSIQTRSTAEKDRSSITTSSNGRETGHDSLLNVRAALGNEQNNIEKKSRLDVGSFANSLGTTESPIVEPSVQPVPGVPSSKKKKSSSVVESDSGVKGKLTPAVDKSTRSGEGYENIGKAISDAPEPRRSNRRIQPTSRLLEGLQSSLIISKIPSFSHDKAKAQHRGASSRGNGHG